jgi:hypothetical protein
MYTVYTVRGFVFILARPPPGFKIGALDVPFSTGGHPEPMKYLY